MNYKKIADRLTTCFRERWRQLLVIAIAITLPPSLVYVGKHSFWKLINDSIFEMGVIFFIVAMMGKWGKWLTHLLFALSLFDFGLSFGCYLSNGLSADRHPMLPATKPRRLQLVRQNPSRQVSIYHKGIRTAWQVGRFPS